MGREAVEREMRDLLGTVLSVLDRVPDEFVEAEWQLLRRSLFEDTLIPHRYKALIGLAVAPALPPPSSAPLPNRPAQGHRATHAAPVEVVPPAPIPAGRATPI